MKRLLLSSFIALSLLNCESTKSPDLSVEKVDKIDILTTISMIQDTPSNVENTWQILTVSIKFFLMSVLLFGGIIFMMLIPVLLIYYFINNYFNFRSFRNSINETLNQHDITSAKLHLNNYEKQLCTGVLKTGSKAFASGFSLFSWVIFSATYMALGFDNFIMGMKEYFFFPFEVFNTILPNNFDQIYQGFNANWIIMIGIVNLTLVFYLIGYYIGNSIGESKIKELESLVANK